MPSVRPLARGGGLLAVLALATLVLAGVATAQSSNPDSQLNFGVRFGIVAVVHPVVGGAHDPIRPIHELSKAAC